MSEAPSHVASRLSYSFAQKGTDLPAFMARPTQPGGGIRSDVDDQSHGEARERPGARPIEPRLRFVLSNRVVEIVHVREVHRSRGAEPRCYHCRGRRARIEHSW